MSANEVRVSGVLSTVSVVSFTRESGRALTKSLQAMSHHLDEELVIFGQI